MPRVSAEHKARRREQILDAARRCFARDGYEGTTMATLEEESGMSRGGILHYFADKPSLFVAVVRESSARLAEIWAEGGFRALLETVVTENPDWLAVQLEAMGRLRHDADLRRALSEHPSPSDAERRRRLDILGGTVREDLPLEDIAVFLTALANGIGLRHMAGDPIPAIDVLAELAETGVGRPGR